MVGAEMPMTSDQVIWSEQNRLHISYSGVAIANVGGATLSAITIAAPAVNTISINDTIVVLNPVTGLKQKVLLLTLVLMEQVLGVAAKLLLFNHLIM